MDLKTGAVVGLIVHAVDAGDTTAMVEPLTAEAEAVRGGAQTGRAGRPRDL